MDKIHKFSPIIKQKFGLVFGGALYPVIRINYFSINFTKNKTMHSKNRRCKCWHTFATPPFPKH